MDSNAILINVRIFKIGPLEAKLRRICLRKGEIINSGFSQEGRNYQFRVSSGRAELIIPPFLRQILYNFASSGPILKIFAFLEMALKFVGTF